MATTNGPDLTAGIEAVERLMDDTCQIVADADEKSWVLGPDNRLIPTASATLYDGPCKVRPRGTMSSTSEYGGVTYLEGAYNFDLPIAAAAIPYGSVFVLTSSRRMPQAVGATLVVKDLEVKTLAVQSRYAAEGLKIITSIPSDVAIPPGDLVYTGHGVPPEDLVWEDGDFYLDLDTGDLYEKGNGA